jgi:hypothetical protein
VNLTLLQTTGTANPVLFTMPIDIKLKAGAWDTTVVLFNNSQSQLFHVYASHQPDTVALDPDNWILHDVQVTPFDKPFIVVDTKPTFLATNDAILRCDTSFLVRNIGFAPDTLTTSISVDPWNAPPDSAIAVFPLSFSLAPGDSQKVTFSIRPRLIPPGYYEVFVVINSRFGQQPRFSKLMHFEKIATGVSETPGLPREFALKQNYPNPFNPRTVVSSQLPVASNVKLVVYDLLGREVTVLVNERRAAGRYQDTFDGSGLASGVYIYRLTAGRPDGPPAGETLVPPQRRGTEQAGSFVQSHKMLLLK